MIAIRSGSKLLQIAKRYCFSSRKPVFRVTNADDEWIKVVHPDDAPQHLPPHRLSEFQEKKAASSVTIVGEGPNMKEISTKFFNHNTWRKIKDISKNTSLLFSPKIQTASNFAGLASEILTKSYKFSRKEKAEKAV